MMRSSLRLTLLVGVLSATSISLCRADAVSLHISGPDGQPVVGAKVRVVEATGVWWRRTALPARDFVSDAQGAISLQSHGTLTVKGGGEDATKATLLARVVAPGLAIGGLQLKAGDNMLALMPGQTLQGVALGDDQKPIAGAHLVVTSLRLANDKFVSLSDDLAPEATSDTQGHWTFEGMPSAGDASIEVRDVRFQREAFALDLSQKAPPLFLTPGATIVGRVLKPEGI